MTKLFTLAALLALTACAPRPALSPEPAPRTVTTAPAPHGGPGTPVPAMACGAVFAAGVASPGPRESVTCQTPDGPLVVPAIDCKDGSVLWQIGGPSVAVAGWARSGQPFNPTADLRDPGWIAALEQCSGK